MGKKKASMPLLKHPRIFWLNYLWQKTIVKCVEKAINLIWGPFCLLVSTPAAPLQHSALESEDLPPPPFFFLLLVSTPSRKIVPMCLEERDKLLLQARHFKWERWCLWGLNWYDIDNWRCLPYSIWVCHCSYCSAIVRIHMTLCG